MPLLPIVTERLELRALTLDDAPVLFHDVYGDPEVMRFIPGGAVDGIAATEEAIERFLAHQRAHGFTWWAVLDRASGELLGEAGLYSYENRGPDVEVGYTLARRAWGRGVATEAAIAALTAAFGPLGLGRVLGMVQPGNVASRRVLEKAGMRLDGQTTYHDLEHLRFVADRSTWTAPQVRPALRAAVRRAPDPVLEAVARRDAVLARLFGALARRFDPAAAEGFEGNIAFRLRGRDGSHREWSIDVDGLRATARPGRADVSPLLIEVRLADLLRLAAGALDPGRAVLDGRLDVEGDFMLATRVGPMFGLRSPF